MKPHQVQTVGDVFQGKDGLLRVVSEVSSDKTGKKTVFYLCETSKFWLVHSAPLKDFSVWAKTKYASLGVVGRNANVSKIIERLKNPK